MSATGAKEDLSRQVDFSRAYVEELKKCLDTLPLEQVAEVIACLEEAYRKGKRVFIIGNGGSAATASHMASDLGKNILPREIECKSRRLQVMALTDNIPWLTALANDLGYEHVFSEQLKSLACEGDLVIAISGSGNSPNILEGVRAAKALGAKVVGFLGFDGGKAKDTVDLAVIVPSWDYEYVEDVHLLLNHLMTKYLRENTVDRSLQR